MQGTASASGHWQSWRSDAGPPPSLPRRRPEHYRQVDDVRWPRDLHRVVAVVALRQRVDVLVNRAGLTLQHHLSLQQERVKTLAAQLGAFNPQATLARGYAIVKKGQIIVTRTGQVSQGDEIVIQVRDGKFGATVRESKA